MIQMQENQHIIQNSGLILPNNPIVRQLPLLEARNYQRSVLNAFYNKHIRNIFLVWHRRCGKDILFFDMLTIESIREPGSYHYIFPEIGQAERAIFQGMTSKGLPYLDLVPKEFVKKINIPKHYIEFKNDSVLHLCGSDQPEKYRGGSSKGLAFSELAYHKPNSMISFLPMIRETKGFLLANSTPQAHNHFYRLYQNVKNDPNWYCSKLTVTDTREHQIITDAQIKEDMKIMSREKILQEYWCDFDVALENAYFAKYIRKAELDKRICIFPIDTSLPVHTVWDIGMTDMTSVCFIQITREGFYNFIHYYEQNRVGFEVHANYIKEFASKNMIVYGKHILPHDIVNPEFDGTTRREKLESFIGEVERIERPKRKLDVIETSRSQFSNYRFHEEGCRFLIDCLMNYKSKILNTGEEVAPMHDWSSHAADSFTLLGLAIQKGIFNHSNYGIYTNSACYDNLLS